MYFHTDTYLPTYLPPNEKRQERDIIKLQSLGNSEMQNMYMDLANTSVKVIWNSQQMNETNIPTYTIKQQILTATVVISHMMLLNLLVNKICIEF